MPKPQPVWERWKNDPKKAERLFYLYWVAIIAANLLIVVGVVMFIFLLLRR